MTTRTLGYTGETLTMVGLGAWAMGGEWQFGWGPQDDRDSIKTIFEAMDLGINWIDTAAIYGFGHSEVVVGQALQEMSNKPFIASKCSRVWDAQQRIGGSLKAESIRKECEDSLSRLRIDTIDLYQIHWPQPEEDIEEGWGAIARLIKEGKIRYAGVSNFSVEQMKRLQPIHPIASLQPPYSMLRREVENETLAFCAEQKIGVIVYSPMQKGLLTGKVTPEWIAGLSPTDHRLNDPMFQEPKLSANLAKVEALKRIAEHKAVTLGQLAIAWTLRRSELTSAIVGARRTGQIQETAHAMDVQLTDAEQDEIETILAG